MKDPDRQEMLQLILAYEELDDDQRRQADEALVADENLRRLLAEFQTREQAAARAVPLADSRVGSGPTLDARDRAAQQESFRNLLVSLHLDNPAPVRRFSWWRGFARWSRPRLWMPAAGAAAAVILLLALPEIRSPEKLVRDLTVVASGEGPSGNRSGRVTAGNVLRTGQAFALTFSLEKEAVIVVLHVDPLGEAAIVHPQEREWDHSLRTAAGEQRIPSLDGDQDWVLGSGTGTETFLVAAGIGDPDLLDLAGILDSRSGAGDREQALDELRTLLVDRVGPVRRLDVVHRN